MIPYENQNKGYIIHKGENINHLIRWFSNMEFKNPNKKEGGYITEESQTKDLTLLKKNLGLKEKHLQILKIRIPSKKYIKKHHRPKGFREGFVAYEDFEIIIEDSTIKLKQNEAIEILPTTLHNSIPSEKNIEFFAIKAKYFQSEKEKIIY